VAGATSASVTASWAAGSNKLTVTAVSAGSGQIQVGYLLAGQGIDPGTTIQAVVKGSGGIGTYNMSHAQSSSGSNIVITSGLYPGSSGSSDTAVFPLKSGVAYISSNVTLAAIQMSSGTIEAHDTKCPDGWTVSPVSSPG